MKKGIFNAEIKLFLLVVLIAVVLSIAGILLLKTEGFDSDGLPLGLVSYEFVKSRLEGQLYYPGSRVFSLFGGPEERNIIEGGGNSAFAGAILISNDPPEQIYAWYMDWMLSHGWQPRVSPRATTQISLEGYARGSRERFSVAMDDPELLSGVLGREVPQVQGTVFEIRYLITPASR